MEVRYYGPTGWGGDFAPLTGSRAAARAPGRPPPGHRPNIPSPRLFFPSAVVPSPSSFWHPSRTASRIAWWVYIPSTLHARRNPRSRPARAPSRSGLAPPRPPAAPRSVRWPPPPARRGLGGVHQAPLVHGLHQGQVMVILYRGYDGNQVPGCGAGIGGRTVARFSLS
jgi:hypothetical protein